MGAEQHRELVRKCLLAILEAGYSPLCFYTSNIKKYYYLGELLALVDLSLARPSASCLKAERCQVPVQEGRLRFSWGSRGVPAQTVKMGVQYSLWGGSVLNLGTERHRKAYFDDIDKFRLPGTYPAQLATQLNGRMKTPRQFDRCSLRRTVLPGAGCFAMTELRHGSNVAALQTEAVLDVATDEWVINTPDEGATKWCAVGACEAR